MPSSSAGANSHPPLLILALLGETRLRSAAAAAAARSGSRYTHPLAATVPAPARNRPLSGCLSATAAMIAETSSASTREYEYALALSLEKKTACARPPAVKTRCPDRPPLGHVSAASRHGEVGGGDRQRGGGVDGAGARAYSQCTAVNGVFRPPSARRARSRRLPLRSSASAFQVEPPSLRQAPRARRQPRARRHRHHQLHGCPRGSRPRT